MRQTQFFKWAGTYLDTFTIEDKRLSNKHMKRCSTTLVIKEMQVKITMRVHYADTIMAKIKNIGHTKCR